jgi:hypothetical protein
MIGILAASALISSLNATPQQTEKSNVGIFAETRLMRMAGMKPFKMPELPAGIKLPANIRRNMPGSPTRALLVRLWSSNSAPDNAEASLSIPSGLELGDKLDLQIYRPTPPQGGGGGGQSSSGSSKPEDITIKIYWGSSATVRDGQPKVFHLNDLTTDGQMMMMHRMSQMNPMGSASGVFKSTGTTAYWPDPKDSPEIKDDATMLGTYTLNSNFAGTSTIDAPSGVDFLAPIDISSPNLDEKPPLDGSLAFQWSQIPNCLGIYATAFGYQKDHDSTTLIFWTSSENYADKVTGELGYMQMADVKDAVSQQIFMSGDSTAVTVPAGIFKDCEFAMYNMFGYGPGAANDAALPIPRIQTKTDLTVMLTGKGRRGG